MSRIEVLTDVELEGITSAYCYSHFSRGRKALEKKGFHFVSGEEHAYLGSTVDKDSNFFKTGGWIKESCAWIPGYGTILSRYSPFIEFPRLGESLHSNCYDFNLNEMLVKKALEDCVRVENHNVSTAEFDEKNETRFLFGEYAKDYGDKLDQLGVESVSFYVPRMETAGDLAFARPLFISQVHQNRFNTRTLLGIIGSLRTSEMNFCVRGIKRFEKLKLT